MTFILINIKLQFVSHRGHHRSLLEKPACWSCFEKL